MSRRQKQTEAVEDAALANGGTLTAERPIKLHNWKFVFRGLLMGPVVTIEGVEDEEAARAALHDMVDRSIKQVERTR